MISATPLPSLPSRPKTKSQVVAEYAASLNRYIDMRDPILSAHLWGMKHAYDLIDLGLDYEEVRGIAARGGLPRNIGSAVWDMMRLAPYVARGSWGTK